MTNVDYSGGAIKPQHVKSPIQLLAVWFVALIAINGSFLSAAAMGLPNWVRATLVLAAVANVPIFLACSFLLQSRFRDQLLSDEFYVENQRQIRLSKFVATELKANLKATGGNMLDFAQGKRIDASTAEQIRPLVSQLRSTVSSLQGRRQSLESLDPDTLRTLAEAELTEDHWASAAKLLSQYASFRPDDFHANFSRGVAFANARDGRLTDLEALRAYGDAIAYIPEGTDPDIRARLFTYKGAMLKRMARYDEALADFHLAKIYASRNYEVNDLIYNLASTYALMGDRENLMLVVGGLNADSPVREMIYNRLGDYFSQFAHDEAFLALIRN